jgi:hypothetical protein
MILWLWCEYPYTTMGNVCVYLLIPRKGGNELCSV